MKRKPWLPDEIRQVIERYRQAGPHPIACELAEAKTLSAVWPDATASKRLEVFFILFFTVGMISKGKVPTSLIILFVMFLIACILALFSRKS